MKEKQLKLNRYIEYIKQQEFPFDTHDVDEDFSKILDYFGIEDSFSESELLIIKNEFMKLAEAAQTEEIVRTLNEPGVIL